MFVMEAFYSLQLLSNSCSHATTFLLLATQQHFGTVQLPIVLMCPGKRVHQL